MPRLERWLAFSHYEAILIELTHPLSENRRISIMPEQINILVSSIQGLGPRTIVFQADRNISGTELVDIIHQRLDVDENIAKRIVITTHSNKIITSKRTTSIEEFLTPDDTFLNLRLSFPTCGGKGGFGSQLRAQGGRMSSRKKKNQGETNGSSRNLDGRRLRTVTEAKALAEYLVVKPEMDKKEKEERMKRWEQVVEMAEKRTEELKNGGKTRLDGKWMEAKEEASEKTKEAILASLTADQIKNILGESDRSEEGSDQSECSAEVEEDAVNLIHAESSKASARTFYGFEEEELSSDDDEDAKKEDS
jgi:hypothetical protein